MKRTYDDERYIPWYRRTTPTWLDLSAEARGVLVSVAMELNDSTGVLTLRRGLHTLSTVLRIPWEKLEPALAELIAVGKLDWDGSKFALSDPEYVDRKRPTSRDRVAKHRELKGVTAPVDNSVTDVTPVTLQALRNDGNVTSSLLCSSLSGSGSDLASPPDWWPVVLESIEANTGTKLQSGEAWLRYAGHRSGKGLPASRADALYWLSTVMVREAKQDRQREQGLREARERRLDPPKPPQPTREQSERFAQELVARVQASKAKRAAGGQP